MKRTEFRVFCVEKYYEHKDECKWWKIPCLFENADRYIEKHKWFLKKMYKERNG